MGQKRRLALALVVRSGADVVLLGGPANHLSPALVEELEVAVAASPATVVVSSHDRRLRGAVGRRGVRLGVAG